MWYQDMIGVQMVNPCKYENKSRHFKIKEKNTSKMLMENRGAGILK